MYGNNLLQKGWHCQATLPWYLPCFKDHQINLGGFGSCTAMKFILVGRLVVTVMKLESNLIGALDKIFMFINVQGKLM